MRRTFGWERRLADYIRASSGAPFSYGRADCGLWAAGAVQAVCGVDPAEPFRGAYGDGDSAIRALHAFAGGGLEAAAAKICAGHGWREVAPTEACDGDLGIIPGADGPSMAVCFGWDWVAQGREGLVHVSDLAHARRAWAVAR